MLDELKAIIKSPKLWITIFGVALIPMMYNVIFLSSMWNPYGKLDQLPVAVVNQDKAATLNNKKLTIGQDMVDNLKKTKNLDYHFVSQGKAEKGLDAGKYYMVITFPKSMSKNAASLMTKNPKKLTIKYQTTKGRSYVAFKMSESAMAKFEAKVSDSITKTYTSAVFKSMSKLGGGMTQAVAGTQKLADGSQALKDGSQTLTDNLQVLSGSSQTFANGANTLNDGLITYTNGVGTLAGGLGTLSDGLTTYTNGVSTLAGGIGTLSNGLITYTSGVDTLAGGIGTLSNGLMTYTNGVDTLAGGIGTLSNGLTTYTSGVDRVADGLSQLNAQKQNLVNGASQLTSALQEMANKTNLSAEQEQQIASLKSGLPQLNQAISALNSALSSQSASGSAIDASAITASLSTLEGQLSSLANTGASNPLAAVQGTAAYQSLNADQQAEIANALAGSASSAPDVSGILATVNNLKAALGQLQASAGNGSLARLQAQVGQLAQNANVALPGAVQALGQLQSGLSSVNSALTQQVLPGSQRLSAGATQVSDALGQLDNGASQLSSNSSQLVSGIGQLGNGASQLSSNSSQLVSGVGKLDSGANQLSSNSSQLVSGVGQLNSGAGKLVDNNGKLLSGLGQLNAGAGQLTSNSAKLVSGAGQLASGADKIASGSGQLAQGGSTLTAGLTTLSTGTDTLLGSLSRAENQLKLVSVKEKNAKAVAAPVKVEHSDKDNVKTNGVGMASYMMSVALMVVALSANVIFAKALSGKEPKTRFEWARNKLFINGIIATAAPIILVLAVQAIGVHPSHVAKTFVIAILAAWSMMALVTALVGWDDRYGSFISMIILLLQLGASAGTYPIQLSNHFFETVQPYLPMSYAVAGFRETISLTGNITSQVWALIGFMVFAMVLALLIYRKPKED